MTRPVDAVIDFLKSEQSRGLTHIHLDEAARDGLRTAYIRARNARTNPRGATAAMAAQAEISAPPQEESLEELPESTSGGKAEQLAALKIKAENWRPARKLGTLRDVMVFSTGNPAARVMLIGEAPGYEEERKREPFVGPAGRKLDDILKAMGIPREDVYISNIVKFRPATQNQTTNNRKPTPEEMESCMPLIAREIAIIRPEVIVALGGTAAEGLLKLQGTVGSMRGKWHALDSTPVRVTYHPSYLLQSGAALPVKRQLWEDMLAVMERLGMEISEKQRGFFLPK